MRGWMYMSVACLGFYQFALCLNRFFLRWQRHQLDTLDIQGSQGAWETTLNPGMEDEKWGRQSEFPSSISHSRTPSPLFFSQWTIPSLSVMFPNIALPFFFFSSFYLEHSPSFSFLLFSSLSVSPALHFDFSLCSTSLPPFITMCGFTGSQGAVYPRDTIPSIHITSRDTDTNYLKGTWGCTIPWSKEGGTETDGQRVVRKMGRETDYGDLSLVWGENICRRSGKVF